jgi:hypothetical protein
MIDSLTLISYFSIILATMAARSSARVEKQQFNVFLPRDVVKQLKHLAIERGESLSSLVERIFREQIELSEKEGKWLPE